MTNSWPMVAMFLKGDLLDSVTLWSWNCPMFHGSPMNPTKLAPWNPQTTDFVGHIRKNYHQSRVPSISILSIPEEFHFINTWLPLSRPLPSTKIKWSPRDQPPMVGPQPQRCGSLTPSSWHVFLEQKKLGSLRWNYGPKIWRVDS
jgi:hypothetical protein